MLSGSSRLHCHEKLHLLLENRLAVWLEFLHQLRVPLCSQAFRLLIV